MNPALQHLILFLVGCGVGVLNVVAAGGSFLTLPLLIFLGLPPSVANGTNRVAILLQNTGAVWSFQRSGIVRRRWITAAAAPALLGALFGAWLGIRIGEVAFQRILAALMLVFVFFLVWSPRGEAGRSRGGGDALAATGGRRAAWLLAFFAAGVYGGFVQAGVGFVLLGVAVLAGLDLVRGNALKVLVVLFFTPLALAVYALAGKVEWSLGAALGAGTLLGGVAGARLTVARGHAWVRRVVLVLLLLFAVRLWTSV